MDARHAWNKLPSLSDSGLTDDLLWRHLLSSGTGETPAQRAGHSFREHQWVHINSVGDSNTIEIDRNYLIRALRLRYRDLAAIDPTLPLPAPSVILVRARAIAINLDVGGAIRLIICENQVYVLSVPKANDPAITSLPKQDHPFIKWMCSCLKNCRNTSCSVGNLLGKLPGDSSSDFFNANQALQNTTTTTDSNNKKDSNSNDKKSDGKEKVNFKNTIPTTTPEAYHPHNNEDMPYELRALEVALTAALGILTAEIDELEGWGYPAVDKLLRQVNRESLENVRKLKNSIDKLKAKVQRLVTEIGDLMSDDDDMADLYLGRRAEALGLLPLPMPGEERDHIDDEIEEGVEEEEDSDSNGNGNENSAREARDKQAEDAFDDRQKARHRDRDRERRHDRSRGSELSGLGGGAGGGNGFDERRRGRGQGRRRGGNNSRYNYARPSVIPNNTRNDGGDDDYDQFSIGESIHSIDLEDEALDAAEEAFLRRQRSIENAGIFGGPGGGGGYGGSSLFGGAARVDPHDIEEAEDLLETMFERSDMLLRRLSLIDERCEDTEDLLELDLDQKRNQLVGLNVVLSAMSMSFGFSAAIGGIFGMNLKNTDLIQDGWVLAVVLAVMLSGSIGMIIAVGLYMWHKKLMFIPTAV
jgi:hypothetical protein